MTAIATDSVNHADVSDNSTTLSESDGHCAGSNGGGPTSSVVLEDGSEYLLVDPQTLIIGPNVRTEADLDKDFQGFARDIDNRGVRAPIIAARNADGDLVVVEGKMRTLAAIDKGKQRVRVLVEPDAASDEQTRQINRIVDQLGDNFHRTANTEADEIRATQQLLDLKVSARSLQRLRAIPRKRAETLVAVARSAPASQSVTDGIADLTQAAVLVEFDDDDDALTLLTECVRTSPAQFGQLTQRLRDRREEARLCAEVAARLTEQGVTVIDEPDTYGGPVRSLTELRPTAKTQPGTTLTVKRHATCPGNAAYLDYSSRRPVDDRVKIVYVCNDFRQHGHPLRWASTTTTAVESGQRGATMTDEQKAARRTVIGNGKAWDSATTFRRGWLKEFAARKTPPKDAARWITQISAEGSPALRTAMEHDHPLALELLGLPPKDDRSRYDRRASHPITDTAATATQARATMLTLVMLLAAIEDSTDRRRTWDSPSREQIAYFTQLAAWGYPLEDVEKLVLAHGQPAATVSMPDNPANAEGESNPAATTTPPESPGDRPDQDDANGTGPAQPEPATDTGTPAAADIAVDDPAGEHHPVPLAA